MMTFGIKTVAMTSHVAINFVSGSCFGSNFEVSKSRQPDEIR